MWNAAALLLFALAAIASAACGGAADSAPGPTAVVTRAVVPALAAGDRVPSVTPTPATQAPRAWPITIAAVGDIMVGRSVAASITAADPAAPFAGVHEPLMAADVAMGNLECAISDRGAPVQKAYTFRAPPLAARGLALAGFDVLGLANNHALDYGADALADTIALLAAEEVATAGAGPALDAALAPAVVEVRGLRIAVLAFADVPSEAGYDMTAWAATATTAGIAWADAETVERAVTRAAASADAVIVMLHFGAEYAVQPSDAQRDLARLAIDSGAVLVVGHHPHVLQEVEEYGGGLIAYSLGNFVFDGFEGAANNTAILSLELDETGVVSWRLIPATIGWDGLPVLD